MIDMRLVEGSTYVFLFQPFYLIKKNYLALVCGVVAPWYQHCKQGATTPHGKVWALALQFNVYI